MNFSLVYLLAPVAGAAARPYSEYSLLEKLLAEETLTRIGAPGTHNVFSLFFLPNCNREAFWSGEAGLGTAGSSGSWLHRSVLHDSSELLTYAMPRPQAKLPRNRARCPPFPACFVVVCVWRPLSLY